MAVATQKESYGFKRIVDIPFESALEKTREALKNAGFGVLTEIDMKAKLKEKLDKDFRNYVILGACNPGFAFEALEKDLDIGLLLPCNVVVYDGDGGTVVSTIDPETAMSVADVPGLEPIARLVAEKLRSALDSIG
jgi:uncharacterized protein (DUF302 family)